MLETVICRTNCIFDNCLVFLFQVLHMPSKYVKFLEYDLCFCKIKYQNIFIALKTDNTMAKQKDKQ